MITSLTALIKRFKPRRYTTLRIEIPIALPRDCSPSEYEYLSSAEIESKALAVHTALTKNCNIVPKRLRGTISYVFDASLRYNRTIVIKCEVPEDAPMEHIRDVLVTTFKGNAHSSCNPLFPHHYPQLSSKLRSERSPAHRRCAEIFSGDEPITPSTPSS